MKLNLIYYFLLFIFFSCDAEKEVSKNNIIGSWYSCVEDVGYIEHHIYENIIEYCTESSIELDVFSQYRISGDTLFFYHSGLENEPENFYVINFINKNEILLTTSGRSIKLIKMNQNIENRFTKNKDEYNGFKEKAIKEFWERKDKYECKYSLVDNSRDGELIIE